MYSCSTTSSSCRRSSSRSKSLRLSFGFPPAVGSSAPRPSRRGDYPPTQRPRTFTRGARRTATARTCRTARRRSCSTPLASPIPAAPETVCASSADPLARGLAMQVHRQLGVDEQPFLERKDRTQAVGEVGGRAGPHERRRRDARQQLATQANPGDRVTRAGRPADEDGSRSRPDRRGRRPRRTPATAPRCRVAGSAAAPRSGGGSAAASGMAARRTRTARARHARPAVGVERRFDDLKAPAGLGQRRGRPRPARPARRRGTRRQPGDRELRARLGLLDRMRQQGRRGPAVHHALVPRPAGQRRRAEAGARGREEGSRRRRRGHREGP